MNTGLRQRFGMPSSGDWRKMIEDLKTARAEFTEYYGLMTQYERQIIQRDIKEQSEKVFPVVSAGAIGEWKNAIAKYQEAGKAYNRALTDEITRWDPGKLNAELQQISTLVNLAIAGGEGNPLEGGNPGVTAKLEALYSEAVQSGDIYKQRATYEVLKTALPKVSGDDRFPVNRLAKLSERELSALRVTNGMVAAKEAQGKALDALLNIRAELIEVSQALGEGDPTNPLASGVFTKALRMVQEDRASGEIRIFGEDDPEVTGVYWPQEMKKAE